MNKKIEFTFKLRIDDIKVVRFSQSELTKSFELDKFPLVEYQTNFDIRVNETDEKIVSIVSVTITVIETAEIFAELIVETSFDVNPIKEVTTLKNDGKYDVNGLVLYNIASVSLSTIRGILYEKLKGSIIQNEIYPLADLSKVFKKKEGKK